jgi:hypothetical protein
MTFPVNFVSKDGIQGPMDVRVIGKAALENPFLFLQATNGKWNNVESDIAGAISETVEASAKDHTAFEIACNGNVVSGPIWERIKSLRISETYGVDITSVRVIYKMPDDIAKEYNGIIKAKLRAEAQGESVKATQKAIDDLVKLSKEHGHPISTADAAKLVHTARLLNDEQVSLNQFEIITDGQTKIGSISIFTEGGNPRGGGGGKNKKNKTSKGGDDE